MFPIPLIIPRAPPDTPEGKGTDGMDQNGLIIPLENIPARTSKA